MWPLPLRLILFVLLVSAFWALAGLGLLGGGVAGERVRDDRRHQHVPDDLEHPEHLRCRGVSLPLQGGGAGECDTVHTPGAWYVLRKVPSPHGPIFTSRLLHTARRTRKNVIVEKTERCISLRAVRRRAVSLPQIMLVAD